MSTVPGAKFVGRPAEGAEASDQTAPVSQADRVRRELDLLQAYSEPRHQNRQVVGALLLVAEQLAILNDWLRRR